MYDLLYNENIITSMALHSLFSRSVVLWADKFIEQVQHKRKKLSSKQLFDEAELSWATVLTWVINPYKFNHLGMIIPSHW